MSIFNESVALSNERTGKQMKFAGTVPSAEELKTSQISTFNGRGKSDVSTELQLSCKKRHQDFYKQNCQARIPAGVH